MFIVTKEIDSENISKLCRTCLREDGDKMVCLFVGPAGSSLAAKLRSLSCLEVSNIFRLFKLAKVVCVLNVIFAGLARRRFTGENVRSLCHQSRVGSFIQRAMPCSGQGFATSSIEGSRTNRTKNRNIYGIICV